MCLYNPSKAFINTHRLANKGEIKIVSPHYSQRMNPESTPHEPPKPFFIQNGCVITYIVARLPYSIFQTQYIFQPDILHMRC